MGAEEYITIQNLDVIVLVAVGFGHLNIEYVTGVVEQT